MGTTHAVESRIVYCVLKVTNCQHDQLLVSSFEVSDQGENFLFKLFGVVVLRRVCGVFRWRVC